MASQQSARRRTRKKTTRKPPGRSVGRRRGKSKVPGSENRVLFGPGRAFAPTKVRKQGVASVQLAYTPLSRIPHLQRGQLYNERVITLTGSAGTAATYFFRANDVFDPNASGTGGQPIGFDQMMLMYEQFYVLGSSIRVKAVDAVGVPTIVMVYLNPDMSFTTINDAVENGLLKSTMLYTANGGKAMTEFRMSVDNPTYFGLSKQAYIAADRFQGTVAASPSEMNYWTLCIYAVDGATTVRVMFEVTLSYDVYYNEPRKLSESFSSVQRSLPGGATRLRDGLGYKTVFPDHKADLELTQSLKGLHVSFIEEESKNGNLTPELVHTCSKCKCLLDQAATNSETVPAMPSKSVQSDQHKFMGKPT